MPRPLGEAVVVITGASSGIGRAAALRFARRGSHLALAARSPGPLEAAAAECRAVGAEVHVKPLDVREESAVEGLAQETVERFGRIDVWVNNAGVIAYGEFLSIPSEVFTGVVETNLMGQVFGARAALRRFESQRAGVLINLSSVWGSISSPLVSPYVVSKNGVRAFSDCLRAELADRPDIHVSVLAPEAVDTPIFDHGANYCGRRIRPIPPILSADQIAAGIEACAKSPKSEVSWGRAGRLLEAMQALAPPLYRRLAHRAFVRGSLSSLPAQDGPGNVLQSTAPHTPDGRWRSRRRSSLRRSLAAAAAGAAAGLLGARPASPPERLS